MTTWYLHEQFWDSSSILQDPRQHWGADGAPNVSSESIRSHFLVSGLHVNVRVIGRAGHDWRYLSREHGDFLAEGELVDLYEAKNLMLRRVRLVDCQNVAPSDVSTTMQTHIGRGQKVMASVLCIVYVTQKTSLRTVLNSLRLQERFELESEINNNNTSKCKHQCFL